MEEYIFLWKTNIFIKVDLKRKIIF